MAKKAGKVGAFYAQTGSPTTITDLPVGIADAVETIFYLSQTIINCDTTTNWTGNTLSNDTGDKKEGTGSLKDQEPDPAVATTEYKTIYNPTGTWDWSHAIKHISFWLQSDRASTAFTWARLYLEDSGGNRSYWDLTFDASTWTRFNCLLSSPDGNSGTDADLSIITAIEFNFKAADTTTFYKKIDWIGITPEGVDRDVIVSVDGTPQDDSAFTITSNGKITFATAPASGDVTATYDYYTISQVGGFFSWSVDETGDVSEVTDFESSGHKEYLFTLDGWAGSAERYWLSDEIVDSWVGTEMVVKFFIDNSVSPSIRYEGWAVVTGIHPKVSVDSVINSSLDFQGTGILSFENT